MRQELLFRSYFRYLDANIDRLDFGLKKMTNNHSHVVFTNENKCQNYKPDPDSKTKIVYSQRLFQYGDMVGLRYY